MSYRVPPQDPDSDSDAASQNSVFFDPASPPATMSNPTVPGPSNAGPSMQDLFQALQTMREENERAQQQLRADNERAQLQLREEFSRAQQQRDQEIANLQAFARAATASPAPPVLATPSVPVATADAFVKRPKPKIPDIPLFSGKRAEYRVWAMYARQKIARDGPSIGDDGDQYTYLFARMSTEAQNLVAVYFARGLEMGYTAATFLAYLDRMFIDPYAAERASTQLQNLRQRDNEPFALFLPKFEKLLGEAGTDSDRASISILRTALCPELRRAMANPRTDYTYEDYKSELFTVSSKLEECNVLERSSSRITPSFPANPAPVRHPDAMDWTPTITTTALKPLTDEERERLRRNRACFRCRQTGHLRQNCPLNFAPTTTVPVRSANLYQPAMPTPALPLPLPAPAPTPVPRDMSGNGEL
ncbi:uncharacterized protein BROUX77_002688 [Berkeleyomyces rouxiae]